MEIKIQCDCGQKFKFDAEPVNGRMPWEVTCPVCGLSGTDKANWIISHNAPASISTPLAPIGSVSSAPPAAMPISPPPAAVPMAVPIPSSEPPKPRLAIRTHAPAPVVVAAPAPAPATPHATRFVPRAAVAQEDDEPKPNFWLSVAAVLIGAVLGMVLWHLGYRLTGWRLGFMALVTGCAAGAAPQVLGHYKGVGMGLIAAFVAAIAIFSTQFLNTKAALTEFTQEVVKESYDDAMKEAKAVLAAAPNGTEQELRAYLAKEQSFGDFKLDPKDVEPEDIAELQARLPLLRELAAGQVKAEQYDRRETEVAESSDYQTAVKEAKAVMAAAPNGTDEELRAYLAKEYSTDGSSMSPGEVDADEVEHLRTQLPQMRALTDGSMSQADYTKKEQEADGWLSDAGFDKIFLILGTLGIFNIVSIVLGIGAAFLTAKG